MSSRIVDETNRSIEQAYALAGKVGADPAKILEVLDLLTALAKAAQQMQDCVAIVGEPLLVKAVNAGIEQETLYDRPYSESYTRRKLRAAGVEPRKGGRPPARGTTTPQK
jgi:hypothetical protein